MVTEVNYLISVYGLGYPYETYSLVVYWEGHTVAYSPVSFHGLKAAFECWPSSGSGQPRWHAHWDGQIQLLRLFLAMADIVPSMKMPKPSAMPCNLVYHRGSVEISEKYSLLSLPQKLKCSQPLCHSLLISGIRWEKNRCDCFFINRHVLPLKYMSGFLKFHRSLLLIKASWGFKNGINLFFRDNFLSVFLHYIC